MWHEPRERIKAARHCETLDVPISFFFAGLSEAEDDPDGMAEIGRGTLCRNGRGQAVESGHVRLPREQRIMIVALVNALAKVETEPDLLVEAADSVR
jgi:hypothetical protein